MVLVYIRNIEYTVPRPVVSAHLNTICHNNHQIDLQEGLAVCKACDSVAATLDMATPFKLSHDAAQVPRIILAYPKPTFSIPHPSRMPIPHSF